jgi:hypothetical protein
VAVLLQGLQVCWGVCQGGKGLSHLLKYTP